MVVRRTITFLALAIVLAASATADALWPFSGPDKHVHDVLAKVFVEQTCPSRVTIVGKNGGPKLVWPVICGHPLSLERDVFDGLTAYEIMHAVATNLDGSVRPESWVDHLAYLPVQETTGPHQFLVSDLFFLSGGRHYRLEWISLYHQSLTPQMPLIQVLPLAR